MATSPLKKFVLFQRFIPSQKSIINGSHELKTEFDCTSIKILNWNIAKKNHDENWIQDFSMILDQYQPDLIFLQEVYLRMDADYAVTLEELSWSFAPNFVDSYHQTYSGILTAAKTTLLTSRAIITKDYEPILNTPKVSLLTEYPLSNSKATLLAVNSHFINFVDLDKFRTQLHELELALSVHHGPIILAGDFNTWSRGRVKLLEAVASRLKLVPVAFAPNESKKMKRFLLSPPLDHIFYRGFSEEQASAKVLDHICSSDHKPMLAELAYIDTQLNQK